MSHVPIRLRALVAALLGAVVLTGAAVPALQAADGPVVTGVSKRWMYNIAPDSITISGSGFTGATAVTAGRSQATDVQVVSDHTIIATFPGGYAVDNAVQVTAGGITSPVNAAAKFYREIGPDRAEYVSTALTCSVDGGPAFDGGISIRMTPRYASGVAGTTFPLGPVSAHLALPARAAGAADPLGDVTGDATLSSLGVDIEGAPKSFLELSDSRDPYRFPFGTSVDGNPLAFDVADLASGGGLQMPYEQGVTVSLRLRSLRATAPRGDGSTASLLCSPSGDRPVLYDVTSTPPAPTIASIDPSSVATTTGGTVHITGTNFRPATQVVVGDSSRPVTYISSTELEVDVPPHAAGAVELLVYDAGGRATSTLTYIGSAPLRDLTWEEPLTCTIAAGSNPVAISPSLAATGTAPASGVTGEPVGINDLALELRLSADDVDALAAVRASTAFHVLLPLTAAGVSGSITNRTTWADSLPAVSFDGLPPHQPVSIRFALGSTNLGTLTAPPGGEATVSVGAFRVDGAGANSLDGPCDAPSDPNIVRIPVTGVGPTPSPSPTPSPTPTPTPSPSPTTGPTATYGYALQGSTRLNTLTKGSMPLTGSVDASLALTTGDVTADLTLNDTQGRFTALGFLPVTATVGFVSSGQTTGKLADDQLETTSKVRIKVKSVKAFGAIPLVSGNSCQTKSLSTITLKSTDAFDPTGTGGTLAGTYAISDLNGCGPLNGLVSPITAGGGNTVSVKLTPKG